MGSWLDFSPTKISRDLVRNAITRGMIMVGRMNKGKDNMHQETKRLLLRFDKIP
jgi:hypothetical protein